MTNTQPASSPPTQQTLGLPDPSPIVLSKREPLAVAGLFAGIGGIESGFARHGHHARLLCELDEGARAILRAHFPEADVVGDVRDVMELPDIDLLAAGFPCQDLSQAGRRAGIKGKQSGLVGEVFRLLEQHDPTWLLLENVPFMLSLDKGHAMEYLTDTLDDLGYTWAYRVLDTRSFGLPQRRQRVILLASKIEDPKDVLFADDVSDIELPEEGDAFGFYWTEGRTGLGWCVEATPPLKKGSTLGIPSPPAIWIPDTNFIGKPDIRDAERLQGFEEDWTKPAVDAGHIKERGRWSYVGNAVTVDLADWLGFRLLEPMVYSRSQKVLPRKSQWPKAAWGNADAHYKVDVGQWPLGADFEPLSQFLEYPLTPLSERATAGFLSRAKSSRLRFRDGFLDGVSEHLDTVMAGVQ